MHGTARKKETAPAGSKDENVFDIMQGVSINIFVKKKAKSNAPAEIFHYDLYGTRSNKYDYLQTNSLKTVNWTPLQPQAPSFFFVPKDFAVQQEYEKGFKVDELMATGSTGIETRRDAITIQYTEQELLNVLNDFKILTEENIRIKYNAKDTRDWKIALAKDDVIKNTSIITKISYRPFDERYTLYTGKTRGFIGYPFDKVMRHLLIKNENLALCTCRQQTSFDFQHVLVSNSITERCFVSLQTGEVTSVFPLYLYPEEGSFDTERRPNLDATIWAQINAAIGKSTSPEDIFDYIYGVLHSPAYRTKYKEFLKVDFPRIPYPTSAEEFEHFRSHGNRLRELHLMHDVPESPVTFPYPGTMQVDSLAWEYNIDDGYSGNIYINDTQCFEGVPTAAFEMYIGGYQPAQKWLKDRKGRTLTFDDIEHYRRIIAILIETDKIMKQIDNY